MKGISSLKLNCFFKLKLRPKLFLLNYHPESSGEKNEGGVIATVHDHEAFVEALKDVKVNNGGKHG